MDITLASSVAIGFLTGLVISYIVLSSKIKYKDENLKNQEEQLDTLEGKNEVLREENLGLQTLISGLEAQKESFSDELKSLREVQDKYTQSVAQTTELRVRLEEERSQNSEKLELLKDAEKEMTLQFSKLANDIFEQKSKVHAEQNTLQLDTI